MRKNSNFKPKYNLKGMKIPSLHVANTLHFLASFVDFKCIIGGVHGDLTAPSELKASLRPGRYHFRTAPLFVRS